MMEKGGFLSSQYPGTPQLNVVARILDKFLRELEPASEVSPSEDNLEDDSEFWEGLRGT